jgi:hypothetical protein
MEKLNRKEIDAITGEETIVELTQEEITQREELAKANEADRVAKETTKAQAKAALLEKLGISEDEAKLLLG